LSVFRYRFSFQPPPATGCRSFLPVAAVRFSLPFPVGKPPSVVPCSVHDIPPGTVHQLPPPPPEQLRAPVNLNGIDPHPLVQGRKPLKVPPHGVVFLQRGTHIVVYPESRRIHVRQHTPPSVGHQAQPFQPAAAF